MRFPVRAGRIKQVKFGWSPPVPYIFNNMIRHTSICVDHRGMYQENPFTWKDPRKMTTSALLAYHLLNGGKL